MHSVLNLVVDWVNSGVARLVVAAFTIGMLTPVTQALLRDPHFDPWIGGILPVSMISVPWLLAVLPMPSGLSPTVATTVLIFLSALSYLIFLMFCRRWLKSSMVAGMVMFALLIVSMLMAGQTPLDIGLALGFGAQDGVTPLSAPVLTLGVTAALFGFIVAPGFDILVAGKQQARLLGLPLMAIHCAGMFIVAGLTCAVASIGIALPAIGLVACILARRMPVGDHRQVLLLSGLFAAVAAGVSSRVFHFVGIQ